MREWHRAVGTLGILVMLFVNQAAEAQDAAGWYQPPAAPFAGTNAPYISMPAYGPPTGGSIGQAAYQYQNQYQNGPPANNFGAPNSGFQNSPTSQPGMQPWPNTSPFDYTFSQHSNEGGLWFHEWNNDRRKYQFGISGMISNIQRPKRALVGYAGAPPYTGTEKTTIGGGIPPGGGGVPPGGAPPVSDFVAIDTRALFGGRFGPATISSSAVNQQRGAADPNRGGVKIDWGFEEPDGSGFLASAFWTAPANWSWSRGRPGDENDATTLTVNGALPLNDGLGGITVPYDKFFKINFKSEAVGGQIDWLFTPRWKKRFLTVRPLTGFRYMYLGESFGFAAADSGGSVTFNADGSAQVGTPMTPPDPVTPIVDPFFANLDSRVRTQLAGPHIGLRADVGGKQLKLRFVTKVGVLANHEEMRLKGIGIGNGFNNNFVQNSPFATSQSHTHLSAMAEESLSAEANLLRYVPVINKMSVFRSAKFRVGYSFTTIWQMARPNEIIVYNGLPLFPQIQVKRSKWSIRSLNFGVGWHY